MTKTLFLAVALFIASVACSVKIMLRATSSPTSTLVTVDEPTVVVGNERYTIVRRGNNVVAAYATEGMWLCYGTFKPQAVECKFAIPEYKGEIK